MDGFGWFFVGAWAGVWLTLILEKLKARADRNGWHS